MISSTNADLRRAVQRLISSSITALIGVSLLKVTPEQEFTGSLQDCEVKVGLTFIFLFYR